MIKNTTIPVSQSCGHHCIVISPPVISVPLCQKKIIFKKNIFVGQTSQKQVGSFPCYSICLSQSIWTDAVQSAQYCSYLFLKIRFNLCRLGTKVHPLDSNNNDSRNPVWIAKQLSFQENFVKVIGINGQAQNSHTLKCYKHHDSSEDSSSTLIYAFFLNK